MSMLNNQNNSSKWRIVRLKNICMLNYGDSLAEEKRIEGEIPVYGSNGIVGKHNKAITTAPCIIIGRKGSYGKVNYSTEPCFPIDTTYWIDKHSTNADLRWLSYILPLLELDKNSQDSAVPGLSREVAYEKKLPLPSYSDQKRIAAYLDQQTAKIDRLMDLRRRQIALLKEQRAALIQQAVTRGLNPNVPMKDSGLPWLGEIPAHWEIKRLKWLATLQRGYDLPDQDRVEGDIPVVTSGGIVANHNQAMAKAPGVVTGRYGSTGNLFYIDSDFWPHNTALYVNDFHDNIPRFVYYVMQTINYEIHSAKSAVPGVDRKDLHENFVVVPPRSEQDEIVDFIESKNEKFNALNSTYSRQLTLLAEYRAALIHECVTGRRPVPDHFDPGVYEND